MKKIIYALLIATVAWTGCKDEDDDTATPQTETTTLTLSFKGIVGTDSLELNKGYQDYADRELQIDLLAYYISNIDLIDKNQNAVNILDAAFIDHTRGENSIKIEVDPGEYKGIQFGIGLDSILNESDPSTYAADHPLSVSKNTYWGWNKYQFFKIEGRVDSAGTSIIFGYHTGLNPMYRSKSWEKEFFLNEGGNTTLNFQLDMNEVFTKTDTVDYMNVAERSWHGEAALFYIADRMMDNVTASLTLME